jgi:hypothetical protein
MGRLLQLFGGTSVRRVYTSEERKADVMSSKGFVNKAKSGTRAMPAHWRQAAAKAHLGKGGKSPKPSKQPQGEPTGKKAI